MSDIVCQIAKAAYVAMHQDKRWAEAAWDDMGGSEPSDERACIEVAVQEALIEHAAQCNTKGEDHD